MIVEFQGEASAGEWQGVGIGRTADQVSDVNLATAHLRLARDGFLPAWAGEILPLLKGDDDPLGVDDLTTHQGGVAEAVARARSAGAR